MSRGNLSLKGMKVLVFQYNRSPRRPDFQSGLLAMTDIFDLLAIANYSRRAKKLQRII
jgi:hypothetical protein